MEEHTLIPPILTPAAAPAPAAVSTPVAESPANLPKYINEEAVQHEYEVNNNHINLEVTLEAHSIELLDSSNDEDWTWIEDEDEDEDENEEDQYQDGYH